MTDSYAAYDRNIGYAKDPRANYMSQLAPQDEAAFRQWVADNAVPFDPEDPHSDYDMRGYWRDVAKGGVDQRELNPNDRQMHFPDTYKTPFHQSFSNESLYAKPDAPHWANDHQLVDAAGNIVFDERPAKTRRRK